MKEYRIVICARCWATIDRWKESHLKDTKLVRGIWVPIYYHIQCKPKKEVA